MDNLVTRNIKVFMSMSRHEQEAARKVDENSEAYAVIGRICYLCKGMIEPNDVMPPNFTMNRFGGDHVVHGQCIQYCLDKYPDVPHTELEGQVTRNVKYGH